MAQTPSPTMSADRLLPLGEFHTAACSQMPETAALGVAFQPVQDELKARKITREAAQLAMVRPRVVLRFCEYRLEQRIRAIIFAAQTLDGMINGGPAKSALAPDGLNAIVRPRGAGQKLAAEAFLRRLTTQPACAPLVAEHKPLFDADFAAFQDAHNERLMAATQLAEARAHEDGAREAWISAYSGNIGAIRMTFPRRRALQELFFDRFRASSSAADEGGDDGDEGDGGDGGGEGGV